MKKFIKHFKNINEDQLNMKLIKREYEDDLIDFVVNVFKSLEVIRSIQFIDYTVEYDESKIDINKYITSRKKKKKKEEHIKYHYIKSDRVFELTMRFHIEGIDNNEFKSKIITRSILLPKKDHNNYMTLKDKKYFLLYQLVDNSTYVSKNGITLKSLMPIVVNTRHNTLTDCTGESFDVVSYFLALFKREIPVFLFYFAKIGFSATLSYFAVERIIDAVSEPYPEDEDHYHFKVNKHIYLKVRRHFFDKYQYVKAVTAMLKECMSTRTTIEDLEDIDYWTEHIGGLFTKTAHKMRDSGNSTITFFERLLDLTTKDILKVSEINKQSIYSIVRWMIQNFAELKQKNNMDLSTKRLRLNEYIASMLSMRLGESVNRLLSSQGKATFKQVENIFKFPGNIVLQLLQTSQLLKYDDRVNDLDIFSALRYTVKGPNSLGSKSDRNINVKFRGVHPSYLGNLDINVYSSSSPGLSGSCTPFAKVHKLYFDDAPEPQDQEYEIMKELAEEDAKQGILSIEIGNNPVEYYEARMEMLKRQANNFNITYMTDEDEGMLYVILGEPTTNYDI